MQVLLSAVYGICHISHSFPWSAQPEDYAATPVGKKAVSIGEVMGRLSELNLLLKEPQIRHSLAEIDLQLSLLPSMVWSDL